MPSRPWRLATLCWPCPASARTCTPICLQSSCVSLRCRPSSGRTSCTPPTRLSVRVQGREHSPAMPVPLQAAQVRGIVRAGAACCGACAADVPVKVGQRQTQQGGRAGACSGLEWPTQLPEPRLQRRWYQGNIAVADRPHGLRWATGGGGGPPPPPPRPAGPPPPPRPRRLRALHARRCAELCASAACRLVSTLAQTFARGSVGAAARISQAALRCAALLCGWSLAGPRRGEERHVQRRRAAQDARGPDRRRRTRKRERLVGARCDGGRRAEY